MEALNQNFREYIMIMADFNAKRQRKEEGTEDKIGPFGLG